jgi:aldose 1-epimerase
VDNIVFLNSENLKRRKNALQALRLATALILVSACTGSALCQPDNSPKAGAEVKMNQDKATNSSTSDPVKLYKLTNKNGMEVDLINLGATIVRLLVPDRNGKLDDVCLGYSDFNQYKKNVPYFGSAIGRYANRIKSGKFTLDGKNYQLPTNDGAHSLHGGLSGFNKKIWNAREYKVGNASVLSFSRVSPDNEEGYPGAMDVSVTYTLTDQNELIISYEAKTDKPTVLNLTNHAYFNLKGEDKPDILNHELKIHADSYTVNDAELIPTGKIAKVEGTPLDFRNWHKIGERIRQLDSKPQGYDNNFVLPANKDKSLALAAEVFEPESGRYMAVYTDEPAIQFYSSNFLNGSVIGKNGKPSSQYGAFCLETQHFPDSPNHAEFPSTVLRPGETFKSKTIYKFATGKDQ